jgi:hypothetical protein
MMLTYLLAVLPHLSVLGRATLMAGLRTLRVPLP